MKWRKGDSCHYTAVIPGEISVKAQISVHSESIVASVKVNSAEVKKWCIARSYGVDYAKHEIEAMLNTLAEGIWEG